MADLGTLGELHIEGTWAQKRMILPIIMAAYETTNLASPAVCPTVPLDKIRGTIPMLGKTPVASQLVEFEKSQAGAGVPSAYDVALLKDRVELMVSDEARMESSVGDPMTLQQQQASGALAANLNKLIAERINTTPQDYGTLGNWASAKPTLALNKLAISMGIYKPTAYVMGSLAAGYYSDAVGDKAAVQNLDEWKTATMMHPTQRVPIYASTDIDNLDSSGNRYVYAVCARVPGVINVLGRVKATSEYDRKIGADVNQFDIWRTPFSNLQQTSGSKNLGVVRGYMTES